MYTAHRPLAADADLEALPGPKWNTRGDLTAGRATNFGRASERVTGGTFKDTPGPGAYNLRAEFREEEEDVIRSLAQLRADVAVAEAEGRPVEDAAQGFEYGAKHKAVLLRREELMASLTKRVPKPRSIAAAKQAAAAASAAGNSTVPMVNPSLGRFGDDPMKTTQPAVTFTTGPRSPGRIFLGNKMLLLGAHGNDSPGPSLNMRATRPSTPVWTFQGVVDRGPLTKDTSAPTESDLAPVKTLMGAMALSTMRSTGGPTITRADRGDYNRMAVPRGGEDGFKGRLSKRGHTNELRGTPLLPPEKVPSLYPVERKVFELDPERAAVPGPGSYGSTKPFVKPAMPRDPHADDPIDRDT